MSPIVLSMETYCSIYMYTDIQFDRLYILPNVANTYRISLSVEDMSLYCLYMPANDPVLSVPMNEYQPMSTSDRLFLYNLRKLEVFLPNNGY